MPGPGAAAGAKAAGSVGGRVSTNAATGSGSARAAQRGSGGAGSRSAGGKGGGKSSGGKSVGRLASFRQKKKGDQGGDQELLSSGMFWKLALAAGALMFFLVVIIAPLVVLQASADSCGGGEEEAVPIQTNHESDPTDLSETQIAIRIYLVGQVMGMTPRQIITAYSTGYVESNMTNIDGGDASSTGVFQQQNFSPWTDDGRNRNNVIDASIAFFLQLRKYDTGQPVGILAAEVQRPAEEYEYRYALWVEESIALYKKIHRLLGTVKGIQNVQKLQGVTISGGGLSSLSLGSACSGLSATGPANLKRVETLYEPKSFKTLPANLWDPNFGAPDQVDTRIWQDVVWILTNYHLRGTGAREEGHATHGDGTAIDMVPAGDQSVPEVWNSSARKLALDLGWTPGCAENGYASSSGGLCDFVPAILLVGYNKFSDGNHGDPWHTHLPHIHVSWKSSCYGCGGGALVPPRDWVKVFPVGTEAGALPTPSLFPPPKKKHPKDKL